MGDITFIHKNCINCGHPMDSDVMTGIRAGESIRVVAYCEGCKHLLLLAQQTRPIFEAIYRNNDVKVDLAVEELEDLYLKARRDTKESIRG